MSPPQNPIPVAGGLTWGQQPVPGQGQLKGQTFTPSPPVATVRGGKTVVGNSGLIGDVSGSTRLNTGGLYISLTSLIVLALIWV
jgi:hypothetical protein